MESNDIKTDLARKNISGKLMIFGSGRQNGGKRSCLKRISGYDTGKEGGVSRHSFAR